MQNDLCKLVLLDLLTGWTAAGNWTPWVMTWICSIPAWPKATTMHICANDARSRKAWSAESGLWVYDWSDSTCQAVTTDLNLTYALTSNGHLRIDFSDLFGIWYFWHFLTAHHKLSKQQVGIGKVGRTLQIDTKILKEGMISCMSPIVSMSRTISESFPFEWL
jgi:hypothetical protein